MMRRMTLLTYLHERAAEGSLLFPNDVVDCVPRCDQLGEEAPEAAHDDIDQSGEEALLAVGVGQGGCRVHCSVMPGRFYDK